MYIIDSWESVSDWGRFLATRLQPAFQKVGGIPQPKTTRFEVTTVIPDVCCSHLELFCIGLRALLKD